MDLNRLYHASSEIGEDMVNKNKYTFWAHKNKLQNYRIITLGTLMKVSKENPSDPPSDYVIRFVNEEALVLGIFNVLCGQVLQVVLRSLSSHKFLTLTSRHQLMYGIGFIKEKSYSDPIVLTEGTLDCDVLRAIYPYVFGCLTSGLSKLNMEILQYLTNHVILAYDSDDVGQKAIRNDRFKLQRMGLNVSVLPHLRGNKDPGDVAQALYEGRDTEAELAMSFYRVSLKRIRGDL